MRIIVVSLIFLAPLSARADEALDASVQTFLDGQAGEWRDLNVPAVDGEILHDLVVERGSTQAFEIGTSTGHSTIWIAWAVGAGPV